MSKNKPGVPFHKLQNCISSHQKGKIGSKKVSQDARLTERVREVVKKTNILQLQEFPTPSYCRCCSVTKRSNSGIAEALKAFGKAQSPSGANRTLLIITDQALATLASASLVLPSSPLTLIHWDLPAEGRKAFERRFSLLRSASCNIHQDPREMSTKTEVHLLLRPHDAPVLPSIMDFLRRCDSKVPEELEVFHTGAMIARERRQQLCSNLEKVKIYWVE